MKKELFCLFMAIFMSAITTFADIDHIVERGESLESIASKYGISKETIIEANPGVESLFYIGMKLRIPEMVVDKANNHNIDNVGQLSDMNQGVHAMKEQTLPKTLGEINDVVVEPGWEMDLRIMYGFIPKVDDSSQSPWDYAASIGVNYWFKDKMIGPFAGVMLGYDGVSSSSYSKEIKTKYNSHLISIPILGGYSLNIVNKKFAITPYIGFSPKFCVKATSEIEMYGSKEKYDVDKKFAIDFNYGIALRIIGFNIIGAFSTPLNDAQKGYFGNKTFFSVGIGYGL